jgi:hypothetical protein
MEHVQRAIDGTDGAGTVILTPSENATAAWTAKDGNQDHDPIRESAEPLLARAGTRQ